MRAIDPTPLKVPSKLHGEPTPAPDDGTRALLKAGFWIVLASLLSLLLTEKVFGGIGIYGARSNAGWLSLMFALMGLPFGLMLLVLGGAKWLRNRRLRRSGI
ncbi:MAG: hypothetical protein ACYCO5_07095 [Acidobacteriaceae bacterium]